MQREYDSSCAGREKLVGIVNWQSRCLGAPTSLTREATEPGLRDLNYLTMRQWEIDERWPTTVKPIRVVGKSEQERICTLNSAGRLSSTVPSHWPHEPRHSPCAPRLLHLLLLLIGPSELHVAAGLGWSDAALTAILFHSQYLPSSTSTGLPLVSPLLPPPNGKHWQREKTPFCPPSIHSVPGTWFLHPRVSPFFLFSPFMTRLLNPRL